MKTRRLHHVFLVVRATIRISGVSRIKGWRLAEDMNEDMVKQSTSSKGGARADARSIFFRKTALPSCYTSYIQDDYPEYVRSLCLNSSCMDRISELRLLLDDHMVRLSELRLLLDEQQPRAAGG